MTNILILSLTGFSFSARQLYETLLPKLLTRGVVHESLSIPDALIWIAAQWPRIILVTDATITSESPASQQLLASVKHITKNFGITTVLMGFFAAETTPDVLTHLFREHFELMWEASPCTSTIRSGGIHGLGPSWGGSGTDTPPQRLRQDIVVNLGSPSQNIIRLENLVRDAFTPEALFLRRVPHAEAVYISHIEGHPAAYAAVGRTGMGKLGYVGDWAMGEEAERFILAVACLDRSDADVSRGVFQSLPLRMSADDMEAGGTQGMSSQGFSEGTDEYGRSEWESVDSRGAPEYEDWRT